MRFTAGVNRPPRELQASLPPNIIDHHRIIATEDTTDFSEMADPVEYADLSATAESDH